MQRRVDFDRPSNVMFVPPEYATINCGIGCTFNGITLRANGSTGPVNVFTGTAVSLLASKNSGSGCTQLLCEFSANGVPIPSNGLNSTSTAFFTPGTYIVHAGCECSGCDVFGDDTVTVNVTSCAAGVSMTTQTAATIPANRARTKLGVGEIVVLELTPAPPCPVTWSQSGLGTLSGTSSSLRTFTAHGAASSPTITATIGGTPLSVTFDVVEPNGVIMQRVPGTGVWHINGTASAGFLATPFITPEDVSFKNIQVREGSVAGVGTDILAFKTGELHDDGSFVDVIQGSALHPSQVNGIDTITTGAYLPPWNPGGTFTWNIPWLFKTLSTAEKTFPAPVTHLEQVDSAGRTIISKGGEPVTTNASDPTSTF